MSHWIVGYRTKPDPEAESNNHLKLTSFDRAMGDEFNHVIYECLNAESHYRGVSGDGESESFDELAIKAGLERLMNHPKRMDLLRELEFMAHLAQWVEDNGVVFIRFA